MIVDTRKAWEIRKTARPSSLAKDAVGVRPPLLSMAKDANGVLWMAFDLGRFGETRIRYEPKGQSWPDALLADWLRPGRWRKPTKRELLMLARRCRHPMAGRSPSMRLRKWSDARYAVDKPGKKAL